MNVQFFLTIVCCICVICEELDDVSAQNDPDEFLNTIQFIRKNGYPAEAHVIETTDGYLLETHRIPHGKNWTQSGQEGRSPVLLQHGIFGSSFDFVLVGPVQGIAFLLADLGFDVWLGNARGNVYSRAHVNLTPEDSKFWNFSWHESGIYDLTAQIDYIRNRTNQEKVAYIGYSMGTTLFFVMTSMLPEYNEKVEVSVLMAPVGYLKNIKSPLLRTLAPIFPEIKGLLKYVTHGEFLGDCQLMHFLGKVFCEMNVVESDLCMSAIFLISGSDYRHFDERILKKLLAHYPSGYSLKALNHYSQLVRSGTFREFDYGVVGNLKRYGFITPPNYQVENITVPIQMYLGKNDYISTYSDMKSFSKRLKTLKRFDLLEYPDFNHMDFIMSSDVKHQLYDTLLHNLVSSLSRKNPKINRDWKSN